MGIIGLDTSGSGIGIPETMRERALAANALLHSREGAGSDFLGWVHLPSSISDPELAAIGAAAARLRAAAEVIVCVGIGGSYLGTRAVLEALSDPFRLLHRTQEGPVMVFAGQNLSEDYACELLDALEERSFAVIVISKSGTTTEPAIAFRVLKAALERRYGREGAAARIAAVTDRERGALRTLADEEGYPTFVIPDDVGGRFSVLTPVGLLPLAAAGVDIAALVRGARDMERATAPDVPFDRNPAAVYAAVRNLLYEQGRKIEILGSYEPKLQYVSEWWKQLYGESEGKEGKGIFPASVTYTADLHSMGQYIQQGERLMLETVIRFGKSACQLCVPRDEADGDGLNFLAGKDMDFIATQAMDGTLLAHVEGGVPNLILHAGELNAYTCGELIYFFEYACGLSGYLLGVNPFDQPGVEAYKKNMFALLGKPGYEDMKSALEARLGK